MEKQIARKDEYGPNNIIKIDLSDDDEVEVSSKSVVGFAEQEKRHHVKTPETEPEQKNMDNVSLDLENVDGSTSSKNQQANDSNGLPVSNNRSHSTQKTASAYTQKNKINSKMLKCRLCTYTAKWPSALSRHMRTHTGEKLYKCHYCSKCYSDSRNLQNHLKTHDDGDDDENSCGHRRCHICK